MPIVIIPPLLRKFTEQQSEIAVAGTSLQEVLANLITTYPKITNYILDHNQKVCSFISIYLNDVDIRHLNQEATQVASTDIMTLVPAIAGG